MGLRILRCAIILLGIHEAYAINWWKTADQKGYEAYQKQQYKEAIELFKRPDWRGVAAFRQKNYSQAIQSFSEVTTPEGLYNLGTALAFQGDYENAVKVYHKVLSLAPKHADAKYNLSILEKMQKEKQKQQQEQNNQKEQQQKDQEQQDNNQREEQEKNNKKPSSTEQKAKQAQGKADQKASSIPQKAQDGQWLKLIEDDPAGLLKQKFLRDYQREVEEGKA